MINFGGMQQVGYLVPSEDSSPLPLGSASKEEIISKQMELRLSNQEDESEVDSDDLAE